MGGLREWVFQKDIPVVVSSYNLTILPNVEFAYSFYKSAFMPISMWVLRQIQQSGNTIQVGIKIDFSKALYEAHAYPELQDFLNV
jgi:hypothetical protein